MTLVDQSPDLGGVEESPQLLFPEAKRRRFRRRIVGIAVAMFITIGVGAWTTVIFTHSTGSGSGHRTPSSPAVGSRSSVVRGTMQLLTQLSKPLSGSVSLVSARHTFDAPADSHGYFTVHVVPGDYRIVGRSPKFQGGKTTCSGGTIHIAANATRTVFVKCQGF
jgi:hypothetical protein